MTLPPVQDPLLTAPRNSRNINARFARPLSPAALLFPAGELAKCSLQDRISRWAEAHRGFGRTSPLPQIRWGKGRVGGVIDQLERRIATEAALDFHVSDCLCPNVSLFCWPPPCSLVDPSSVERLLAPQAERRRVSVTPGTAGVRTCWLLYVFSRRTRSPTRLLRDVARDHVEVSLPEWVENNFSESNRTTASRDPQRGSLRFPLDGARVLSSLAVGEFLGSGPIDFLTRRRIG